MRADEDGHDAEFHAFMVGRWPSLVRFAYGLTGDHGHAEDLAQAALAKALVSWSRVRRADDPDAYVRRILINLNRRRFRRRRVEEHVGGEAPEPAAPDSTDQLDQRATLIPALMELPPGQRAVVILRYWDGLTETQTAAILGCSVGNVRSQASRALARLRTNPRLHDGSAS
ncbi:RNA polymerase, sigma-24 subunit, ECF subfamily [Catenulispora acidiphila DSM 44928]|uniref:RNA polymerase, sigma-24 subunit, ECF subfamily n=1 Tax=Catenulispora acidiphila (strain DSM 44928 / JCM 14897 / NBRC 102108 / NRRL B-24433 / ID139908) TaxID=479433 RepID=C7QHE1_CATAD|nr:SigE family RNA polymerase sigma factor [Catenulispora acidiphila]ACU69080.1 RNA polymerase, sigma-24 subunit, ECF subfamily [Catenulispora acidiphila DSM 44928]